MWVAIKSHINKMKERWVNMNNALNDWFTELKKVDREISLTVTNKNKWTKTNSAEIKYLSKLIIMVDNSNKNKDHISATNATSGKANIALRMTKCWLCMLDVIFCQAVEFSSLSRLNQGMCLTKLL